MYHGHKPILKLSKMYRDKKEENVAFSIPMWLLINSNSCKYIENNIYKIYTNMTDAR